MIDDQLLRALAATQRSLITVDQARELGYGRHQRARLFDGRRWERVTPRVLRLVGSPITLEQRSLAALLDAGLGAALGGSSAAAWWGIPGNRLEPFHVVRARDRSSTPARGDRLHEPTCLPDDHIVVLEGLPELPLVLEIQSERFHSSLIDQQLDAQRIERLERAGLVVVEVTDVQVWHRPREVVDAVHVGRRLAALRARSTG